MAVSKSRRSAGARTRGATPSKASVARLASSTAVPVDLIEPVAEVAPDEGVPVEAAAPSRRGAGGGDGAAAADTGAAGDDPVSIVTKRELIARVVARSGAKKRDAKGVVEATLAEIGEALSAGAALNIPPLGKMTVNRQKDLAAGEVLIVKLRRQAAKDAEGMAGTENAADDPLAQSGKDG